MRDLYKALGFSNHDVSTDQIRSRIPSLPESLKKDVEYVLLHEGRRKVYDRNYRTLQQIGILRATFGDAVADGHWGDEFDDFKYAIENSRSDSTTKQHAERKKRKSVITGIIVVGFLVALVLVPTLVSNSERERERLSNTRAPRTPVSDNSSASPQEESTVISKEPNQPAAKATVPEQVQKKPTIEEQREQELLEFKKQHAVIEPPATGVMVRNYNKGLAPLEIITRPSGHSYFIKLITQNTKEIVFTAFIRSGERFETDVPLGNCILRYATGKEWFGEEHLFGPETSHFEADDIFTFSVQGNSYVGYTVELILQTGGNLQVDRLTPEQF